MSAIRIGIGLVWALSFVAGREMWSSESASANTAISAEITAQPVGPVIGSHSMETPDPADPRVDLFGNEVEDALADYRVDFRGDLYEQHSPDTAVQKSGVPST